MLFEATQNDKYASPDALDKYERALKVIDSRASASDPHQMAVWPGLRRMGRPNAQKTPRPKPRIPQNTRHRKLRPNARSSRLKPIKPHCRKKTSRKPQRTSQRKPLANPPKRRRSHGKPHRKPRSRLLLSLPRRSLNARQPITPRILPILHDTLRNKRRPRPQIRRLRQRARNPSRNTRRPKNKKNPRPRKKHLRTTPPARPPPTHHERRKRLPPIPPQRKKQARPLPQRRNMAPHNRTIHPSPNQKNRPEQAQKTLKSLASLVKQAGHAHTSWGFNEYYVGKTGKPAGNDRQAWSASGLLYAADAIEKGTASFGTKTK